MVWSWVSAVLYFSGTFSFTVTSSLRMTSGNAIDVCLLIRVSTEWLARTEALKLLRSNVLT